MASSPARVVLVDDNLDLRSLLRTVLELKGYVVVGEAGDGAAAVDVACAPTTDVVVMDLNMPVLNGIEATRQIKASRPDVPVVFYSAYEDKSLISAAVDAGADGWVSKGGGAQELFTELARVLDPERR